MCSPLSYDLEKRQEDELHLHIVWKLLKMSHLNFWILAFYTNFCPIKIDPSGNTVWPQASGFQKLAKMDYLWHFHSTFVLLKCKRSSLRSQCWMRLFLWFSNTVYSQVSICLKTLCLTKYFVICHTLHVLNSSVLCSKNFKKEQNSSSSHILTTR